MMMIGLLRILIPPLDRRRPDRFRDETVRMAVEVSERRLEFNGRLRRELAAIESAVMEHPSGRGPAS